MCTTCGCGTGYTKIEGSTGLGIPARPGATHAHAHAHPHGHAHPHTHDHARDVPAERRRLQVEQDLLARNDAHARDNRSLFEGRGVLALNLVSSPGAGKTTLLEATLAALRGRCPLAVIEGDQQTSLDAERIRALDVPAVQINTGHGCHLDAHGVGHALEALPSVAGGVLFIENVGNLVCPAAFDLGEAATVLVLSVTEGDDKPLKYPDIFRAADLLLLNKIDLLPHVRFDVARCVGYARRIRPEIEVLELSATRGDGLDAWTAWIDARRA